MLPDKITELSLQTTPEMTAAYADLSFDHNPLHLDAEFAGQTPFGSPIIHGAMALNLLLQAIENSLGPEIGSERLDIRFSAPVKVGERITAGGQREVETYSVWVRSESGANAITGTLKIGSAA